MKKHPARRKKEPYFKGTQDKEYNIASMRKYLETRPELDKLLEKMIAPYLKNGAPTVLDACCGIGHLSYQLHEKFPRVTFHGVDQTSYLIEEAQKLSEKNLSFEIADLFDLPKMYPKKFDVAICWKTLTWLPSFEDALVALFAVTKKHIFISSLFYDGDIDYRITVLEHIKERGAAGSTTFHNIYSLPRFKKFAYELGAKKVSGVDFKIGIDLPRGDIDHMGTYTVMLKNGERMQMSGALPMPWKIIHIEL